MEYKKEKMYDMNNLDLLQYYKDLKAHKAWILTHAKDYIDEVEKIKRELKERMDDLELEELIAAEDRKDCYDPYWEAQMSIN